MDQFSHDLTLALEETSRLSGVRDNRWGQRRRTCSTGNLPCAPQPTEDSSSSPTDAQNERHNPNPDGLEGLNSVHSDSDDRQDVRFTYKANRCVGNFESDSLNENFSPARFFRPNTRRKRKLRRMAVEYETTPSTPGVAGDKTLANAFPLTGAVKKRVMKHITPDNCRTNLFFCGKRKRSHRDRYFDHDHVKLHSSSVPRQGHLYMGKNTFPEIKTRTKSFSSSSKTACERILPLNKGLVSKIERIAQRSNSPSVSSPFMFAPINPQKIASNDAFDNVDILNDIFENPRQETELMRPSAPVNVLSEDGKPKSRSGRSRKHKNQRLRKQQLKAQLQFDDPTLMECGDFTDLLSSSSLSSSDSEGGDTNESDREGDDELTDWPGNEVMVNFASKNDFKRKLTKKSNLPLIKSDELAIGVTEDDTLMSADEIIAPVAPSICAPAVLSPNTKFIPSAPIKITSVFENDSMGLISDGMQQFRFPVKQIESEMSGETSNPFLASPPFQSEEIREIRAGCRRIKEERPGFSIKTSVNERLAKFLQDGRQSEIRLPDIELCEHDSLTNLAKLYSLQLSIVDNDCAVLSKTSNTTKPVKIDHQNFSKSFFLSDYKRRCYDGGRDAGDLNCDPEESDDFLEVSSSVSNSNVDSDLQHQPGMTAAGGLRLNR